MHEGKVGERMAARRRRKSKLSPFTVFGVLVLCCVLCGTLISKTISLKAESAKYSEQILELKKEQKKLKDQKTEMEDYESYVKTKEYTEEVARDKLGLVYPNEIIFEPNDK